MRKIIYILLIYFSVLNLVAVSNLHVHHDSVLRTVHLADKCNDGTSATRESDERENLSEHLYENGCIVSPACSTVTPVLVQLMRACDLPPVEWISVSRQQVLLFPNVKEIFLSPCPVTFRLRAPPSIV